MNYLAHFHLAWPDPVLETPVGSRHLILIELRNEGPEPVDVEGAAAREVAQVVLELRRAVDVRAARDDLVLDRHRPEADARDSFALRRDVAAQGDQPVHEQEQESADRQGEPLWRMPMVRDLRKDLDSPFADMSNVGGPEGGAITAALFLKEFIDLPWAHLDIAGTAWHSGQKKGATGRPVPLLAEFILSRCNALP